MTLAALQAGKHVLVEKPFALTVADCDEMIAAQQQSGKLMMVGQVLRFWPEYRALIDFVQSGAIGRPLSAVACRLSQAPAWSNWFRNPEQSGGAVIVSSHMLHLVQEICTRVVIIDRGKKVADGTIAELASQARMAGSGSNLEQIFLQVTARDEAAIPSGAGDE